MTMYNVTETYQRLCRSSQLYGASFSTMISCLAANVLFWIIFSAPRVVFGPAGIYFKIKAVKIHCTLPAQHHTANRQD